MDSDPFDSTPSQTGTEEDDVLGEEILRDVLLGTLGNISKDNKCDKRASKYVMTSRLEAEAMKAEVNLEPYLCKECGLMHGKRAGVRPGCADRIWNYVRELFNNRCPLS